MATITGNNTDEALGPGVPDEDDLITGAGGNDTLTGGAGNDRLFGENGDDVLLGGIGDDRLDGGNQGDILIGGDGADILDGGNGNDTASYVGSDVGVAVTVNGGALGGDAQGDVLTNVENLIGSGQDDTLAGDAGDNLIDGGGGSDILSGGLGADTLIGGPGIDYASYETATGPVTVNLGTGLATGADGSDSLRLIEGVIGGGSADTIRGNGNANLLVGGAGNDSLIGGSGNDTLIGGVGSDTLDGGSGLDFADYTDSDAAVNVSLATGRGSGGHAEGDRLTGVDGLVGSDFNDTLTGFDAFQLTGPDLFTNVISGGGGADLISGLAGPDTLNGGTGNDTVLGGTGNDTMRGDEGDDLLFGGSGADSIEGGANNDMIEGGTGNDALFGGDGNDVFITRDGDLNTVGGPELVFGGGGAGTAPDDLDTIDLTAFGWSRVLIIPDAPGSEDGEIILYAADGVTEVGRINYDNIETIIPCFTPGTMILTDRGVVAVEALRPGDLVMTRDNGLQPLRWVGRRDLSLLDLMADPDLQPVRIARGALNGVGPDRDMLVSPQHRLLMMGPRAELLFGEAEHLVAARHLLGQVGVSAVLPMEGVCYIHLLFDRHEIVQSDGIWSESFQPEERMLSAMEAGVRAEVLALFPALGQAAGNFPAARPSLRAHEAKVLLAG